MRTFQRYDEFSFKVADPINFLDEEVSDEEAPEEIDKDSSIRVKENLGPRLVWVDGVVMMSTDHDILNVIFSRDTRSEQDIIFEPNSDYYFKPEPKRRVPLCRGRR